MPPCIFCRIVSKEIPSFSVYESDRVLAFLDIEPRAMGHVVVIPKGHSPLLTDLPESEVEPLFVAVRKVAQRIREVLNSDGVTIGMNQGESSGQTVPHLHVHIIPRWKDDGGGSMQSVVNNPPKEELSIIQEKIKIN